MVDSSQLTFLSSSKSRDTKNKTNIINPACALVYKSIVSCQLPLQMTEEIGFENGRISNFQEIVTLTLARAMLHSVVHHPSTSTYMPNFIET